MTKSNPVCILEKNYTYHQMIKRVLPNLVLDEWTIVWLISLINNYHHQLYNYRSACIFIMSIFFFTIVHSAITWPMQRLHLDIGWCLLYFHFCHQMMYTYMYIHVYMQSNWSNIYRYINTRIQANRVKVTGCVHSHISPKCEKSDQELVNSACQWVKI